MESSLFKTVGQIAGVAGIAMGVLLVIFRDILRKNIFPKLGPTDAYRIIRLMLILTWSIALAGLGAWVYGNALTAQRPTTIGVLGGKGSLPAQRAEKVSNQLTDDELNSLVEKPAPPPFGLVCRKRSIFKFDEEYAAALHLLPGLTSDYRQMCVYVRSLPNGTIYAHSNFVTKGYEYPTKLVTNDQDMDLANIALNLVFDAMPAARQKSAFFDAVKTSICFFLDDGLFSKTGRLAIETRGASKLFVVSDNDHLQTIEQWKAQHIRNP